MTKENVKKEKERLKGIPIIAVLISLPSLIVGFPLTIHKIASNSASLHWSDMVVFIVSIIFVNFSIALIGFYYSSLEALKYLGKE